MVHIAVLQLHGLSVCMSVCPSFWVPLIVSGMEKATDFEFGQCIHWVHVNKSPLEILEKRVWAYPGAVQFFGYPLLSEMGEATNFKFCMHIYRLDWNKSSL